ncbi:MAG: hypothetical protein OEW68_04635 [Gammaproteobacteria bacterium]|nr:hypothetical protein [Gammaproteobacteria bacterium]MDH4314108.1 hypothetical protein [Gammaproteobacteria bacterium]MDH5213150.1 hypothetical protein [Gammaproteobacteria bacterium]MDH5501124.1 hypothetical protein [Gammaproteobacteria bacterium]
MPVAAGHRRAVGHVRIEPGSADAKLDKRRERPLDEIVCAFEAAVELRQLVVDALRVAGIVFVGDDRGATGPQKIEVRAQCQPVVEVVTDVERKTDLAGQVQR